MRRLALAAVLLASAAALPGTAHAIVGGEPATRGAYPFMIQLESRESSRDPHRFSCGATVVRPAWVLTAAHCVEGYRPADLRLLAGRARLSDTGGEELPVAEVIVHETYTAGGGATHDVALLRLGRETATPPARIVGLDERDRWAPGVRATVVGWGATSFGGDVSDELREVTVPIQSDGACQATVGPTIGYDPATELCAGELLGGGDSCQGDSGGPLLVGDGRGGLAQTGVVSEGLGCAYPTQYGVYARIGDRALNEWLSARLGPPSAPAPPASDGSGTLPASAAVPAARLRFAARLGSVRTARRRGAIRLRVRTSRPLRSVRATVRRGSRVVASGRRARVARRAVLRLRIRPGLRAGSVRVRITARDAAGRLVRRSGRARLSR